jgi:REP element-mobilizing transposase RayT
MSRAWRIEYEGALYHLLSRGNERSDTFFDERDRQRFLDTIEDMSQKGLGVGPANQLK